MKTLDFSKGVSAAKVLLTLLVIIILGAGGYVLYSRQQNKIDNLNKQVSGLNSQLDTAKKQIQQQPSYAYTSAKGVKVKVYLPAANAKVTSPLTVMGEVPGNWSFEASFVVRLKDSKGNVIAHTTAQLTGDWMTDQLVPFTAKLEFAQSSGNGSLVLVKDNPSGLAKNDDSITIPLSF